MERSGLGCVVWFCVFCAAGLDGVKRREKRFCGAPQASERRKRACWVRSVSSNVFCIVSLTVECEDV